MTKLYLRTVLSAIVISPLFAWAQDPIPVVEYTVHYGDYGDGVDLTGYVTYDVYLEFNAANPNPALTTVYAAVPDLGAEFIIDIETDCPTFQHDQGGPTVESLQCFLLPFFQSLEWDSFLTIGSTCKAAGDATLFVVTTDQPALDAWENTVVPGNFFDGGSSLILNNTAVFRLPGDPLIIPGPDNRILIARITTCGSVCLTYSIQYFPDYTGPGSPYITALQDACFDNPCTTSPMDVTPTVGSLGCFGEDTQVNLSDGGFGPVEYTVFSGNNVGSGTLVNTYSNQDAGLSVTGLAQGNYYISMIDDAGCRDTTAVFTVTEPLPLAFNAELVTVVQCFGESNGQIQVNCSGGTGQLSVMAGNLGPFSCGDLISDLPCGTYNIVVTDENNCQSDTTITIVCPTQLAANLNSTNIPCFGYDNGTITGTITGGTGLITANLFLSGGLIATQTGTGTLNLSFTSLDNGSYTVEIVDVNNCSLSFDFIITEPIAEFSATTSTTDAICFGSCNGTVVFDITGGTLPLSTVITLVGGGVSNPNALCAGDYTWIITDNNGCTINGEFTIGQPEDITYELSATGVSCFGFCDGLIDIFNVAGGDNTFTYSLSPNSGICGAPCSGPSVNYSSLCSGNYTVTITDGAGCPKVIPGMNISTPTQLLISLSPQNVSCFEAGDGQITISASGGTGVSTLDPGGQTLPFTVTDLVPGTYAYTVIDENGCMSSDDAIITEPELLVVTITSTVDAGCGGVCDGQVFFEVTGGTTPYIYSLDPPSQSGLVNGIIGSLCASDYILNINDARDCLDTAGFNIAEPLPLFINTLLNSPTCTGMFDGSAIIEVGGGSGELTTVFNPQNFDVTQSGDSLYTLINIGEGVFTINLFDEDNCNIQDTIFVIPDIITDMILSVFTSPETCWNTQDGTATVAVQNGFPPISYLWDDSFAQTTATAVGLGSNQTYTVVVTDEIGCTLTTEAFVPVTEGCFFISTGITPNGDGVNDTWVLGGLEFFPNAKIEVFNRWGQVVYQSTGYNAPWDGRYRNELLPVADYYFIIDYADDKEPITGTVTIKY